MKDSEDMKNSGDRKNSGDLKNSEGLKNSGDPKNPGDLKNSEDLRNTAYLNNPKELKKNPIKAENSEVLIKSVMLAKPKVQNIPVNPVDPELQINPMKLVNPEVQINPVRLANPEVQINPVKLVTTKVQNNAFKLTSPEAKIGLVKELNPEVQKKSLNDEVLFNPYKMVNPEVQKIQINPVNSEVQEKPIKQINPESQINPMNQVKPEVLINPIKTINPEVAVENTVQITDTKEPIDLDNPIIPVNPAKQSGGNESQKQMHLLEANLLKSVEQHKNSKLDSSTDEINPLTGMSSVEQSSPVGSQSVNNSDSCLMELLQVVGLKTSCYFFGRGFRDIYSYLKYVDYSLPSASDRLEVKPKFPLFLIFFYKPFLILYERFGE